MIRHNSTYQTIYAHMSKFTKGIRKGVRVKQGQTIGYGAPLKINWTSFTLCSYNK